MYYYRNKKLAELYISDTKIAIDYPNYQDYNEISELEILKNISEKYEQKFLITWSMGVFVAAYLRKYFENFDKKIAINGTITPVDNEFGIPVKMFELTLKHASVGLGGKFYKNVYIKQGNFIC